MKVLVFGSNGLVGKAIVKHIRLQKNLNVIESTRQDTDLFSLTQTRNKINIEKPDVVIVAAAKVGGIYANNTQRFKFILDNLKISTNIFEAVSEDSRIKVINIGSSCIYPLGVENPIKEESLMTGKLEPTNSPYSMAKLTAVELGKSLKEEKGHNVINLMPTNLYGPNDHFEEMNSHVIPGLIYKMHQAVTNNHKEVEIWGSGKPLREFMHVDDLASAIVFLLNKKFDYEVLNIGTGEEVSIKELAEEIKEVCNFKGKLKFNSNLPDGNPRKLLDSTKMNNLGWSHKISLKDGLKSTYEWYIKNI
ncbi:MAG: GDP-fucose synthetase [Flavobacteriaceae bacterium]|jgi:GDP-L-fucose synthase|nr:GDP-fucose synthetase [Flavobacteriaceae bacterium]|tara:strand:- start:634 stop:1548 length:915 start_codon:yes stop_codon:yes gene_type:complete